MSLSQNSSQIYEVLIFPQFFKTENISTAVFFFPVWLEAGDGEMDYITYFLHKLRD